MFPIDLPGRDEIYGGADDFMPNGNSTIVAPSAQLLEGLLIAQAGLAGATLDLERIAAGRRTFDPVGHHARPDVLSLKATTDGENNE